MITIPAFWVKQDSDFPILEKDAGVPFLLLSENGHDILFKRNKTTVLFKFVEVSANTQHPSNVKDEITRLMKSLYDAWQGVLPNQGRAQFYGFIRGGLMSHIDPEPTKTMHWVHIGLGYTTYPMKNITCGVPERVQALCDANQLPMELVLP
jgi:hypothetical protein